MARGNNVPEPFIENAVYTTEGAAAILHRHPNTIRDLCRRGLIPARCDRGGYLISGWAIRNYVEGVLPVNTKNNVVK